MKCNSRALQLFQWDYVHIEEVTLKLTPEMSVEMFLDVYEAYCSAEMIKHITSDLPRCDCVPDELGEYMVKVYIYVSFKNKHTSVTDFIRCISRSHPFY